METKLGNQAKAGQIAGNLNTLVCLYVLEERTTRFHTDQLPQKVSVSTLQHYSSVSNSPLLDQSEILPKILKIVSGEKYKFTSIDEKESRVKELIWSELHHGGSARGLAMYANNQLAAAYGDREIRVWDVAQGIPVKSFVGHTKWPTCLITTTNGYLISGSSDKTVRVWSDERCFTLEVSHEVRWMQLLAEGRLMVADEHHVSVLQLPKISLKSGIQVHLEAYHPEKQSLLSQSAKADDKAQTISATPLTAAFSSLFSSSSTIANTGVVSTPISQDEKNIILNSPTRQNAAPAESPSAALVLKK